MEIDARCKSVTQDYTKLADGLAPLVLHEVAGSKVAVTETCGMEPIKGTLDFIAP
jgi:hypothetical protein